MTDRAALLAAVIAAPGDDVPRLVYADYLQETGDAADVARAEFIRLEIETDAVADWTTDARKLKKRANKLFAKYKNLWAAEVPYPGAGGGPVRYRRGFADDIELTEVGFQDRGEAIFAAAPVSIVRLTWPAVEGPLFAGQTFLPRVHTLETNPARLAEALANPRMTGLKRVIVRLPWPPAARHELFAALAASKARVEAVDFSEYRLLEPDAWMLATFRGLDHVSEVNVSGSPLSPEVLDALERAFGTVIR